MDRSQTSTYIQAMQAVDHFYRMLHSALRDALKGVKLKENGAYGWRGYQILEYQDLAGGQYYCELYTNSFDLFTQGKKGYQFQKASQTTCKDLHFQESYQDPGHKALDSRERDYGIKADNYYYPFQVSLDLYRSRFFLLNLGEQYEILRSFISAAAAQALIWQGSDARKRTTHSPFLQGRAIQSDQEIPVMEYRKVGPEMLEAWILQDCVFKILFDQLDNDAKNLVGKEVKYLRPNASQHNFGFRGWRLKFDGLFPDSQSDFVWKIDYMSPGRLYCLGKDSNHLAELDIEKTEFLDLSLKKQNLLMGEFVQSCLKP